MSSARRFLTCCRVRSFFRACFVAVGIMAARPGDSALMTAVEPSGGLAARSAAAISTSRSASSFASLIWVGGMAGGVCYRPAKIPRFFFMVLVSFHPTYSFGGVS